MPEGRSSGKARGGAGGMLRLCAAGIFPQSGMGRASTLHRHASAAKQSSFCRSKLDCFVASLLAMTTSTIVGFISPHPNSPFPGT